MRCSTHPHWRRSSSTRPETDRSAALSERGFVRADPDSGRRLSVTGHLGLSLRQVRSGPNHPSTQSRYQPAARPCIPRRNPQSFTESFRRRRANCTVGTSTISLSTTLLDPDTCPRELCGPRRGIEEQSRIYGSIMEIASFHAGTARGVRPERCAHVRPGTRIFTTRAARFPTPASRPSTRPAASKSCLRDER